MSNWLCNICGHTNIDEDILCELCEEGHVPVIIDLWTEPEILSKEGPVTLYWECHHTDKVELNILGTVPPKGSHLLHVSEETVITLKAENNQTTRVVSSENIIKIMSLEIQYFRIDNPYIFDGSSSVLSWSVLDAEKVEILPDVGVVPNKGSVVITGNTKISSYQLRCKSGSETKEQSIGVFPITVDTDFIEESISVLMPSTKTTLKLTKPILGSKISLSRPITSLQKHVLSIMKRIVSLFSNITRIPKLIIDGLELTYLIDRPKVKKSRHFAPSRKVNVNLKKE